MDVKQEPFDPHKEIIEPDTVSGQMEENDWHSEKLQIIVKNEHGDNLGGIRKVFESQTTAQIENVDEIEYEKPKIEQHFDHDLMLQHVEMFPTAVKNELQDTSEVNATDIKQEISEYLQLKNENEMSTLKIENTDYPEYFIQPCYSKQTNKKSSSINVTKKKRIINQCPVCQKNFHSSKSRSKHIDRHFGKRFVVCKFCGHFMSRIECFRHDIIHLVKKKTRKSRKQEVIKDIEYSADQPFKCDVCLREFNQKRHLQRHLLIHTIEKPFKCEICFKQFDFKCYLKRHLLKHYQGKPFKCDICSKTFSQIYNLQKHLVLLHSKKPFKCDICSSTFNRSSHLRKHLIIHNNETPFKCDICCKEFKRKFSLQQHLLFHTNEKSFKCEICSKLFKQKSSLQNHLIIHSNKKPFKCDICSKGFNQSSTLRHHLVLHNSKKQFKCDICSKEFSLKAGLKRHLVVHSKEKPFKCEICCKAWKLKCKFQKHLKTHEKSA